MSLQQQQQDLGISDCFTLQPTIERLMELLDIRFDLKEITQGVPHFNNILPPIISIDRDLQPELAVEFGKSRNHWVLFENDWDEVVCWQVSETRKPFFTITTQRVTNCQQAFLFCCCNLSGDVALNVWFTTNGMCVKNNTIHICGANKQ